MTKWQKVWEFVKRPKGVLLAVIYVLTVFFIAAALTLVIIGSTNPILEILSYISYAFAAIFLFYSVYTIIIYAPSARVNAVKFMRKSKFASHLLDNWGFRTVVFACFSLVLNFAYSIFNGAIAFLIGSIWYGALALYYVTLTLLRGSIIAYHKNKNIKYEQKDIKRAEIKKYRRCGVLIVILPLSLSFAILEMVISNSAFIRYGWVVYAVAAYAFYKIIMAIYNMFKAKKNDDMTVRALRCISLADALVSILALQTTLLYTFSTNLQTNAFANALTGAAVCAITLALGIYMIINANKLLKKETTNGQV
ncbi:MAG: hypothetical protein E7340_00745 [Clostridiales bacterium]|nr:hypothetical protein [Clostridiales bacterium]